MEIEAEEENGVKDALACDGGCQMAMQATLDISEPRNRRQAMESPEWGEWRKAEETEMLGMVENCIYKQMARPKDKLVVGTKMLYKRKIRQDGKVEKYKCRLVGQGFWQVEGVYYTESTRPRQRPRQSGCFWHWQRPRTESCSISMRSRRILRRNIH